MSLSEIEEKINEIFRNTDNRIVVWYDGSQEFKDKIDNIHLQDAKLFVFKENPFYTKYIIEYKYRYDNFLLYIPQESLDDKDNFLTGITSYGEEFREDKISLILKDLDWDSSYGSIVEKYLKFFDTEKIEFFKDLQITCTEKNIILGILAVLTNLDSLNINYILRKVLVDELNGQKSILNEFEQNNILDDFWNIIYQDYGYKSEEPSIQELMDFLIINYTANQFGSDIPSIWKQYTIQDQTNSRIFIDEFMKNRDFSEEYNKIADEVQERLDVYPQIKDKYIDDYIECDSFRIFDEKILYYYFDVLNSRKDSINSEFKDFRKKTHFYKEFKNEYKLLYWANTFMNYFNEFDNTFISNNSEDIIDIFLNLGVFIDMSYRKFYYYLNRIDDSKYKIEDLINKIEKSRFLIENMYDEYLNNINYNFVKSISQLDSFNEINYKKQWKFFRENGLQHVKNKTVVFISDAFRYSCALELKDRFDKNSKRNATLTPMLSTIPSYTALGMASLLPNKEIKYDGSAVLVDEKRVKSTEEREKRLKENFSNSALFRYKKLKDFNRDQLRTELKDVKLLYIYHDRIDTNGENDETEDDVFNAVEKAINEIEYMVKKLRDSVNFGMFYITSDHGFIYKKGELKGYDRVDLPKEKNLILNKKRFLLSDYKTDFNETYCFSLNYMGIDDIYVTVPDSIEVFKQGASVINYVHGGASLEECIIPLLEVKADKGAKNKNKVELKLGSNKRVTNRKPELTFFQNHKVSEDYLPLRVNIYFVDKNNDFISSQVPITADVDTDNSEDRTFTKEFEIQDIEYSSNDKFYLVIEDSDENQELERIPFDFDIL